MNREILFRGKAVCDDEWIEGSLVINKVDTPSRYYEVYRITDNTYGFSDEEGYEPDFMCGIDEEVDPSTVGQYTGLKDKNGKRIFDGDICRFREWSKGDMCWIGRVHWEHQQFVISGGRNKECDTPFELRMSRFVSKDIEVIGNIHDNPELLNN